MPHYPITTQSLGSGLDSLRRGGLLDDPSSGLAGGKDGRRKDGRRKDGRKDGHKDHGRKDHGRKDHGHKDHGHKDHGHKDHGHKDHGRKDGHKDHGCKDVEKCHRQHKQCMKLLHSNYCKSSHSEHTDIDADVGVASMNCKTKFHKCVLQHMPSSDSGSGASA